MRKLTLSIAAATLATAGVAFAAPGMMPKADMTRAQVQATAAEHFAKLDVNSDGKLDTADRAAMQAKAFDRIDADHNGAISRDEFTAKHAGREHAAGEGRKRGHRMGGGHGMPGHRDGHGGMALAKMADTNGDRAITQAEFSAAALKHFDTVDADHNGTLTQAERQAAHAAMKAKWQAGREARQADRQAN